MSTETDGSGIRPSINFADCLFIVSKIPRLVAARFGSFFVTVLSRQADLISERDISYLACFRMRESGYETLGKSRQ